MAFELHHRKHIEHELTKIVRKQLQKTAHALTTSVGGQFRTAVHESRKSVKKVRAVAALLTEGGATLPRRDRKRLKSAARALSRVRDIRRLSTRSMLSVAATRRSVQSIPTASCAVHSSPPATEPRRWRSATAPSPARSSA